MALEYITCEKCGKQQKRKNFHYCGSIQKICKFCNKKTNVIPNKYNQTTEDVQTYLSKITYHKDVPISLHLKMIPVFEFLERQHCKEQEAQDG